MRPFGSGSRGARGHTGRLRRLPGNTTPAASLQGVPLLLSASRLVAWCLPLGVHPPVAPPLARACSRWVRPQGVFSAGVRCRSVLLPRRSAFSGRGPDTLLGFSTSADTPCSLATVSPHCCVSTLASARGLGASSASSRCLSAAALSAGIADLQRLPATGFSPGGLSAAPFGAEPSRTHGCHPPWCFRPSDFGCLSTSRSRLGPRPRSTTASAAQPPAGYPAALLLPTGASPPAARRWLITCGSLHDVPPVFEVFFSRSPLPHRSAARSPLGRSPRLRGSVSLGCPCLSARLRSWPFLPRVSAVARVGSQAGPSASSPREDVLSTLVARTAALAFLACLLWCPGYPFSQSLAWAWRPF